MLLPIHAFSRLIVTGKDRVKYLHNFCTNNVKELSSGNACEAFFCDVKARVIAHGYVLAFDDCHEFWMLAGDEAGILKHLNRYIITEDVTVRSATETTTAVAAIGTTSAQLLLKDATEASDNLQQPLRCARLKQDAADRDSSTALSIVWADTPMLWLARTPGASDIAPMTDVVAAEREFEQLRIRERFPKINQDLSIENMAPEAERNTSAISYVKGCYLGQEPIARLDAMGHVNRALRCVESASSAAQFLQASILTPDGSIAGVVTSATPVEHGSIGLAIIRSNAINVALHCVSDGRNVAVKV
jgi:folate-binding protein YgfZ